MKKRVRHPNVNSAPERAHWLHFGRTGRKPETRAEGADIEIVGIDYVLFTMGEQKNKVLLENKIPLCSQLFILLNETSGALPAPACGQEVARDAGII